MHKIDFKPICIFLLKLARLQVEAEMLVQGPSHVDGEMITAHARDLKAILEEADLITSKAFLRTFIKRIEIKGDEGVIRYTLPVPPHGKTTDRVSVLPIETPSGAGGISLGYARDKLPLPFNTS